MKLDEEKDKKKEEVEKSRSTRKAELEDRYLFRDQILREIEDIDHATDEIKEQKASV
jgi:hypothetical protein